MKYLIGLLFLSLSFVIKAQTIKENTIDEFTKKKVMRTSWDLICRSVKLTAYTSVSKINDDIFISLKLMPGLGVFSISEGDEFLLKLANDSIVKLKCLKYTISCIGCGAIGFMGSGTQGISVDYPISVEQYNRLLDDKINKIRIYTSNGYIESGIKEKFAEVFKKQLTLIK
jgi:hypothetical protein